MRFSRLLPNIAYFGCALVLAAYLTSGAGAFRKTVPQNFSANDFDVLVEQAMGNAAEEFGSAETVKEENLTDGEKFYNLHYVHGVITLFIRGANGSMSIVNALDELQAKQGLTCTQNKDFKDAPDLERAGLILGTGTWTCTKVGEKDFVGYVLMIDDNANTRHLYQVFGVNVPNTTVKGVTDRLFARLKSEYGE
jgi:hypothetical protein